MTLFQRVSIGAAAVGALVHVATLFPTAFALLGAVPDDARPVIVAVSATLLIAVLACSLAILLVVRAGTRHEARALALFLVLVAICWGSVLRFASLEYGPDGAPTGLEITLTGMPMLVAIMALALASASLLTLSVRFPTDLAAAEPTRRPDGRSWMPWATAVVTPFLLQPGLSVVTRSARALGADTDTIARVVPWALGTVVTVIAGIILGMLALAARNFVGGYRRADPQARRSALWLVVGLAGSAMLVVASILVMALEVLLPAGPGLLSRYAPFLVLFAPLVMVVCVAVAILHAGAVDPRLALRRSTINGIAGTVGLLVFAGLENALSGWVEGRLGLPGSVGSFLAGTVSAGVFLPLQRRLSRSGRAPSGTPAPPEEVP